MEKSIHYSETIVNELKGKKIYEKFSECILKHIVTILISIFSVGYKGKTVNFAIHSGCHRTTIAHFLNRGKWDDDILESAVKQAVINIIYAESQKTGKPILCIIDDTIASKTKPSSHSMHPIESAYFHFSHLKKKQDYGHQAISVMLSCNGITLNYAIMIYDKSVSKIKLVSDIAKELPIAPNISYLLCDSWYTCSSVFDSFCKIGFYTVGALKTNRILYPYGKKLSVCQLAEKIEEADAASLFHIVTVKGRRYYVFRYEGNLKGTENAVVLLTFPVGALYSSRSLRAFICTNAALSNEEILDFYVQRWKIEVFFRDVKTKLAFDQCQIRSARGIQRFWRITSLAFLIACCTSSSFDFSEGYLILLHKITEEQISFIFHCAENGISLSSLIALVA